jgi:hypothetical protein
MHTVDLAFWHVLQRYKIVTDVGFYCLPSVEPDVQELSELPFAYLDAQNRHPDIFQAEAIVYWGDFLHHRSYLHDLAGLNGQSEGTDGADLVNFLYALFFLEGRHRVPGRVIVFGGNLMILDSTAFADNRYISSLKNLYALSSVVLMRDPYSAIAVNHLLGNYRESYCGVDCAFLLGDVPTVSLYRKRLAKQGKSLKVGVFAGRSWYYDAYFRFCERVCLRLDTKGAWIPWFHHRPWPLLEKYSDVFDASARDVGLTETLKLLDECSLVISDTYHLCVNAWARGIPAICVGRGVGAMRYSIDDKKKEALYSMIGVGNLYVYAESLLVRNLNLDIKISYDDEDALIDSLCATVKSQDEMATVFERIDAARFSAEDRLVRALR